MARYNISDSTVACVLSGEACEGCSGLKPLIKGGLKTPVCDY
jgi:hypothetical protein